MTGHTSMHGERSDIILSPSNSRPISKFPTPRLPDLGSLAWGSAVSPPAPASRPFPSRIGRPSETCNKAEIF